jgi:hypothetical protein
VVLSVGGDWPTTVGGGPTVFFAPTATTTRTVTPTATPTGLLTPLPTATPTATPGGPAPAQGVAATCIPRPRVAVSTASVAPGRLQVTVSVDAAAHAGLQTLRFGAATNAQIEAGGQSGPGDFTVTLAPGTQQTAFTLQRVTAGQAATVPLTVVDSCVEWPTVVGGGPSVF